MKVFISSTYEDLKNYRQAAIEVVNRCKWVPLAMEFFTSMPHEPTKACEQEINECDVFVGIYAHRYGFIPDGESKSITHLEYDLAKKLNKACLCFVVKEDYQWNPQFFERKKYDELVTFLEQVKKKNVVSFFEGAKDFESKLAVSLARLIEAKQGPAALCTPLAPTPYIAHPYPLPGHFTGRDAEQAMLSNWFFNEKKPVLVLEAIGGMGKSALTWVWLHHHILEPAVEIDGVFWWSFYEAPFELFLLQLASYVLGKRKPGGGEGGGDLLSAELTGLQAGLHQRRFLLVLDGLERALRGYSGMEAMYTREKKFQANAGTDSQWEKQQREPIHPLAARFLQHLASEQGQSRVLITSRLMPVPLEDLAGVKHVFLQGLAPGDGVRFLRGEGVKGTAAELEQAGRVYEFHPLMLKLLASAIKRSRGKDVQGAYRLNLIDTEKPHKILTTGFNLLTKQEQEVVSRLSVFRGVFKFETAQALFPKLEADRLWELLVELRGLGFLFYDEKQDRFDFHPILRSFLYHGLTNRAEVHTLAVGYFQPLAEEVGKIVSLEDLDPVIELYHHLVKAGKYDEARVLFRDRIADPAYYQLSAYRLIIELLRELFPDGEDRLPRLEKEPDQAWTLNTLANTYALSGQPARAVPLYLLQNKLQEKNDAKKNLAIGLGNVAGYGQMPICQLSAAAAHLRKSVALSREIEAGREEAIAHQELGRMLAFQGKVKAIKGDSPGAEEELSEAFKLFEKNDNIQSLSIVSAYRSLSALVQARLVALVPGEETPGPDLCREAVARAREALAFAVETIKTRFPVPRDFVRAYWLLGEALIQSLLSTGAVPGQPHHFEIPFYDEYFQEPKEMVQFAKGKEWAAAERCLNEALRRCRQVNLVESEPDILLAQARLLLAKASPLAEIEKTLAEAYEIAQRAGYRLTLADLHLFCGQVLCQSKEKNEKSETQTLLGLKAHAHLEKTKEYALDVSELSHLYPSPDPGFYKGIPEYEMLKRGLTREERIKNGYQPAYRMAELLMGKEGS
jgi:tetratricopeptide (TPR) repeat protein